MHFGLDALSNQKILKDIYFVPSHLHLFQFLQNIKNIAAARKVLKEVLKVSEEKKVSISEAITFPFEILDEFCCHLLLPAMLSGLPIQKIPAKISIRNTKLGLPLSFFCFECDILGLSYRDL